MDILHKQEIFTNLWNSKYSRSNYRDMSTEDKAHWIKENITYLICELGEFLQELPYFKTWKDYPHHKQLHDYPQYDALCMEYIDILIFLLDVGILLNLTDDKIDKLFNQKWNLNMGRHL